MATRGSHLKMGFHFNGFCHGLTIDGVKGKCHLGNTILTHEVCLAIHDSWTVDKLAQLYVKKVVRLHVVPSDIIPDRDSHFQARF